MSRPSTTRPARRLNLRALAVLAAVAVAGFGVLAGAWAVQRGKGGASLLREAKVQLGKNESARALGYLNEYLHQNPNDTDALDLKATTLADLAQTEAQAQEAAEVLGRVLGRDPGRLGARRRLVKMYLKVRGMSRAAEPQARALVEKADDAEAHRLLAQVMEQVGAENKNGGAMEEARREYETAEKKEPGDVEGAERLAALYRERLDKPEAAGGVLDQLVAFTAGAPGPHAAALLARARHFNATGQPSKAEADVELALKDDPSGVDVRLAAAEAAVRKRDTAAARLHLESIDPARRDDLRVKVSEGLIDLAEQRPDDAVRAWRAGLVRAGGNDADLTWKLAYVLLQTGRAAEAAPLVEQFRRLAGGETPDPAARYLDGLLLLKTNRPAEAAAGFEAVRYKVDKRLEPELHFGLGQAYEAVRDDPKALEAYRKASETSREWSAPWLALARLEAASDPAEAAATLRRGLTLYPRDPRVLAALAQMVWRREAAKPPKEQSWDEVARAIDDAKRAAPGAPEVAIVEAETLSARGRAEDAAGLLGVATKMNPRSPELWLALANALARTGKLGRAIDATERAASSAGPQAAFYVTRASLLVMRGEVGKARDAMVEGLGRVPNEQKPLLWKSLGDFHQVRGDAASARAAFLEWAKLQPENPDPRVALFELAMGAGDGAATAEALDGLKRVGGPKAYYWRAARVEDLIRPRKGSTAEARDARHAEAEALVAGVQADHPRLPLGYLLEARLAEAREDPDKAAAAYEKALKLGAGAAALNPLAALLVREHRGADLSRLRETLPSLPGDFDRVAAARAMKPGDEGRAEQLAAMAVRGDPQGLDVRAWRAEVLPPPGKPDEAEAALELLATRQPERAAPWLKLLMFQIGRHDSAGAAATVAKVRENVRAEHPELLWAQCYRASGDLKSAGDCYREALRRWPDDPAVLTSAAAFYEQTGRRGDAEAALRTILKRDRANTWAARALARSLASRAGNQEAWEQAVALVGDGPRPDDVPEDTLARASVFASGPAPRDRERALTILLGLLDELPDLAAARENAARLLAASGRALEARDHAARAAAGGRAKPDAVLLYAGTLLTLKDVGGAEAQLARLSALDPDGLPVAELAARVLTAKGRTGEAAAALEHAFDARASTPEASSVGPKMVRLLTAMNQPEAAERVARKVAAAGPKGDCVLAAALAASKKADEAASALGRAARAGEWEAAGSVALDLAAAPGADPRWLPLADEYLGEAAKAGAPTGDLLQKQALVRHFQGRYDEEVALFQRVLDMSPDNYLFLNNMAWTVSEELGHHEKGREWADEAIRRAGDRPDVRDTRGVILTRLGELGAAIADLESAARDLPGGPVYYHLARAYAKAGRAEDARRCRELAKKSGLSRAQLQPSELADWDEVMTP